MGRGIELTDGETGSLPIPANAELVIEGVAASRRRAAGRPARRIHRLLRPRALAAAGDRGQGAASSRKSPILTAALMAKYPSCEIGAYYAIMRSARILDDLERIGVPGVVGAYAHPAAASGWGIVVVSMQQQYAGHAAQVLALTAQCPAAAYYTKWIIAVDDDVDPTDLNEVMWALSTRCHPSEDIDILQQDLVDRPRPEPVRDGAAALRLEGADRRLQAAPAPEAVSADDAAAPRGLRARRGALGRVRIC